MFSTIAHDFVSALFLQLKDRQHFVENSDMYTIQDLITVNTGGLLEELSMITASFGKHIKFDCVVSTRCVVVLSLHSLFIFRISSRMIFQQTFPVANASLWARW